MGKRQGLLASSNSWGGGGQGTGNDVAFQGVRGRNKLRRRFEDIIALMLQNLIHCNRLGVMLI